MLPKQLLKGLGFDHVHGRTTDLYPDNTLRRAVPGQHLKLEFALKFVSQPEGARVSLGFWSGGFSSTAGYVPGNEARLTLIPLREEMRATCTFRMIDPSSCRTVFIRSTRTASCDVILASLSASVPGDHGQRLSAPSGLRIPCHHEYPSSRYRSSSP